MLLELEVRRGAARVCVGSAEELQKLYFSTSTERKGAKCHSPGGPRWAFSPGHQGVCYAQGSPSLCLALRCLNDRYQPLTLISTKWLMFKVLVKKRDNYNKTQSGIFFFNSKWQKKKKDKCCTRVQDESSDSWKDSEGQRAKHAPCRRCCVSEQPPSVRDQGKCQNGGNVCTCARKYVLGLGWEGQGMSAACWGPDTDSGKGSSLLKIHKTKCGEMAAEQKPFVNRRLHQRVKATQHQSE